VITGIREGRENETPRGKPRGSWGLRSATPRGKPRGIHHPAKADKTEEHEGSHISFAFF
jgi:hypothetical protein